MERNKTAQPLIVFIEGGIIVALCMILQFIPHDIGVSSIQVVYGLIPLGIYAIRRGFIPATIAGGIWGVLDWLKSGGGVSFGPQQIIMEYPLAFALLGLIGLGSASVIAAIHQGNENRAYLKFMEYFALGVFAKYLIHFIAGFWFWGMYAPKWANPYLWSLIVNGGSFVANLIMGAVIFWILIKKYPRIFIPNK